MPTGNPFEAFSDFMAATPKSQASGIDEFSVYLEKHTWLLNGMKAHGNMDDRFFKGTSITDQFIPDISSTGVYRKPNGAATFSMPQHFATWVSYPSLHLDAVTWTAYEFEQNGVTRDLRGGAQREVFKKLKSKKFKAQQIGQAKQFESDLLAAPDYAEMEGTNAFRPRSLFCYINEGLDAEWTTLQGVDISAVPQFSPERVAVNINTGAGTANWEGFYGMDILCANVARERIPFANMEQSTQGPQRFEWLVSSWGHAYFQRQIRSANDHLRKAGNDAAVTPMHDDIPVRRVTGMNDAPVWSSASSATGKHEQNAHITGPRFILMDYAAIQPRFHQTYNFLRHKVRENPRVIGTQVMPIETWWTVLSTDPRSCGVLSPTVNVTVPASGSGLEV